MPSEKLPLLNIYSFTNLLKLFFGLFEKSMRRLQLLPNGFEATNLTSCLLNSNWCFSLCNKEFNMKKSNIAVNPLQQQAKVIIQG